MNCPICKKSRGNRDQVVEHIEKVHDSQIPDNMNGYQYLYLLRYGKENGNCVVCGLPTEWNNETQKPARLCKNPECRESLRKEAKKNMDEYYGEDNHPVNDPDHQAKMQKAKKKNLIYKFKDGGEIICLSKDEYSLVSFLEKFLELDSSKVVECPFKFEYMDGDKKRYYLPDLYLPDYNLIIEGKDKNNTNPQFLKETRYKVKLKADAVSKAGKFNYIIVYGKDYKPLMKMLYELRTQEENSDKKLVIHNETTQMMDYTPDLLIGLLKENSEITNIVVTTDQDKSSVYLCDHDSLIPTSTDHPVFKNKKLELYRYSGDKDDSYKKYIRMFNGSQILLKEQTGIQFLMESMSSNGMNIDLDNIISNNTLNKNDFFKLMESVSFKG